MSIEQLATCPFCGGAATPYVRRSKHDEDRYGAVQCSGCTASVCGPWVHYMDGEAEEDRSVDGAIAEWNCRVVGQWQPISTAPHDHMVEIRVTDGDEHFSVWWRDDDPYSGGDWYFYNDDPNDLYGSPGPVSEARLRPITHWHPVVFPPLPVDGSAS